MAVSANTNCREGPGTSYLSEAVLVPGEKAEVIGRGGEPGYWFVTGETLPEGGCWLWGEYATIEGDVDALAVFTAAPSPTPHRSFDLYVKEFQNCGDVFYVVFAARNVSNRRIWSGYVDVQDLGTKEFLYSAAERHPFADAVMPVCPPGHGNELWPGQTRYIHAPISARSGHQAVGIVTLCTDDHQQGDCSTEYAYFTIP